jgi:DNA (cytosine-5)-methyltransferase 1
MTGVSTPSQPSPIKGALSINSLPRSKREWHCIPASAVGAPHQRDRIWIAAYPECGWRDRLHVGVESGYMETDPEWCSSDGTGGTTAKNYGGRVSGEGQEGSNGDVAHSDSYSRLEWGFGDSEQGQGRRDTDRSPLGENVADTDNGNEYRGSGTLQMGRLPLAAEIERNGIVQGIQWSTEPDVGRVAHGVPARVDRLRALGNALVPQIPEMIGLAILRCWLSDDG